MTTMTRTAPLDDFEAAVRSTILSRPLSRPVPHSGPRGWITGAKWCAAWCKGFAYFGLAFGLLLVLAGILRAFFPLHGPHPLLPAHGAFRRDDTLPVNKRAAANAHEHAT